MTNQRIIFNSEVFFKKWSEKIRGKIEDESKKISIVLAIKMKIFEKKIKINNNNKIKKN